MSDTSDLEARAAELSPPLGIVDVCLKAVDLLPLIASVRSVQLRAEAEDRPVPVWVDRVLGQIGDAIREAD